MRTGATLILVATAAACSSAAAGPAEVAEAFVRKWDSGECEGLGALLSDDSRLVAAGFERLCSARAALRKEGAPAIRALRVTDAKEEAERASIRLETEFTDGRRDAGQPIVLVRRAGVWRVDLLATGLSRFRREGAPAAPPPVSPAPEKNAAPGNVV